MGRSAGRSRKSCITPIGQRTSDTRSAKHCTHLKQFHRECTVFLQLDGARVGTAKLMGPGKEDKGTVFRRFMHGSHLRRYAKRSEDLIVIVQVTIYEWARPKRYPYSYGGVEGPPNTLAEMEGGIHSWDVHALSPVTVAGEGEKKINSSHCEGNDDENINDGKELGNKDMSPEGDGAQRNRMVKNEVLRKGGQRKAQNRGDGTNSEGNENAGGVCGVSRAGTNDVTFIGDGTDCGGKGLSMGVARPSGDEAMKHVPSERVPCRSSIRLRSLYGEPSRGSGRRNDSGCGARSGIKIRTGLITQRTEGNEVMRNEGNIADKNEVIENEGNIADRNEVIENEGNIANEKDKGETEGSSRQEPPNTNRSDKEDSENDSMQACSTSSTSEEVQSDRHDEEYEPSQKRKYNYISRRRRDPAEETSILKRRKIIMNSLSMTNIEKLTCCSKLKCFQSADKHYLRAQASRILKMSQHQRRDILQSMLDSRQQLFNFNGQRVCCLFLEQAFGFSRYLQATVKGTPAAKRAREDRDHRSERANDSQRESIICYLERLAESTADRMPDREEYHLPFFKKDDVYVDFAQEYRTLHPTHQGENGGVRTVPSRSYFYQIWTKYCSNIKVRKNHRFAKCGDCERLREGLEKSRGDPKVTGALMEKKRLHNEMIMKERREYAKKIQKTLLYPQEYCSIIVDGADQSAFGLPHFRVAVKEARGHSIGVKLIGVLEHGHMKKVSLFLMTEQYETGANHIIEAVHRHLSYKRLSAPLPRTLYVQVDNCFRENKNQFFFAYLESLVAWGVFCDVYASFLPIGHTHADIDQVFSRTSTRLRHHDAITMEDLMVELSKSYTPQPHVIHMKGVVNFSGLCRNSKCVSAPTGFTSSRYFHFGRSEHQGADETYYRTSCFFKTGCENEWEPLHETGGNGFIVSLPNLRDTPPTPVTAPRNLDEVNRRLASEECRIQASSIRSLRQLRDEVYRTCEEPFHWNLSDCIENNGRYKKLIASSDGETDSEDLQNDPPRADLEYDRNDFVAIKADARDDVVPFWIAKVEDVERNGDGVIVELVIHWFELVRGKSAYKGAYKPSSLGRGRDSKPYVVKIHVDTVVYRFSKLTAKKELSVNDQKGIWQSLH